MADTDSTTDQAADEIKDAPEQDVKSADESQGEPDDKLGEGGQRALRAEREARRALEKQVADLQAAQQSQLDQIAKALGLKSDETPDPAKLTEQLTAEQSRAREAAVQLAVYRSPAAKDADVDALLDSTSFQKALADVDPADSKAVTEAVETFIEDHPRFKVDSSKPRSPRPDKTQGRQAGQPLDPRAADLAQIEADLAATRR